MALTDTYVVSFEDDEHRRYAHLCSDFGFSLELGADLKIGHTFVHPGKRHIVRLDRDEGAAEGELYEPHLFIYVRPVQPHPSVAPDVPSIDAYDTPMYPDHYSDLEWAWLQGDQPSNLEMLKRELHIWFEVRPKRLRMSKPGRSPTQLDKPGTP